MLQFLESVSLEELLHLQPPPMVSGDRGSPCRHYGSPCGDHGIACRHNGAGFSRPHHGAPRGHHGPPCGDQDGVIFFRSERQVMVMVLCVRSISAPNCHLVVVV